MDNILRKENLKKGLVLTIVGIIILSNAIPIVFSDSEKDEWGNKLSDNIAYTTSTGGYCKVTAQGVKVGLVFPYVEAEMLSVYLYKAHKITFDYSYVKNGQSYSYSRTWIGGNVGKKVLTINIPAGTTSFSLTNCKATFEFNPLLLPAAGIWGWFCPRYVYLGPISDYK